MPGTANLFHIESDIGRAWTLPSSLYTDASVSSLEKEKIFSRTWQVVGHASQVANSGDYFTTELAGEPLLIVRGADSKLRGFYNVCRHRAGPPGRRLRLAQTFPLWLSRLDLWPRWLSDQRHRNRRRRRLPPGRLRIDAGSRRRVVQSHLRESGSASSYVD
ncbi:MAG: aromatic ring-hydroxylating oxygenase subunit alpha [Candidatus Sulfotelmatobacter sp.]